jgi:hypothetical protein
MIFANEWRRKLAFQHPCKSFRFVEEHVLGLTYYLYCMHFLKSVNLNSVVQPTRDKAHICALCICNKVGNGVWFVCEEVGGGTQPVWYEVDNTDDCKCYLYFQSALFLAEPQPAV